MTQSEQPANALTVRNLVKRFGNFTAVDNISFAVPPGAFLVLVGPSGCGKSTLLRMIAGLEDPSDGEILFHDEVVSSGKSGTLRDSTARNVGMVFQSYALWPHMSVAANTEWPLKVAGWSRAERAARVNEVLEMLDIGNLARRFPAEISGGQQQRVAIARTIGPKPSILLLDEPLSNLDAKLRVEMRAELMRIHRATGATSVYVTHDQVEAMTMATHVAVLNAGRVEQFGPPAELLKHPATTFVATFLGTPPANLLPVAAGNGRFLFRDQPLAEVPQGLDMSTAQLMYRAENVAVGGIDGRPQIEARFSEAAPMAGRMMVTGTVDGLRLTGLAEGYFTAAPGDPLIFSLMHRPDAIFDKDGKRLGE